MEKRIEIWPRVSVIIVNWNGERFLDRCLSALLAQAVAPSEIILVDNASTDASIGIVRQYPSVRLLAQNENLGFARANNLAIAAADASSEWIVLLNPDAFVEPRWLEMLLTTARDYSDFDVFGSTLVNAADPTVLDGAGDAYHISGLVWRMGHGARVSSHEDQPREIFSPCAAAAMYRRSVLIAAGGFDEDYFCYVEDVDLGFRLRLAGVRCLHVPTSVVYHVGSGTTGDQHSDFAVYYGHRNLMWTYVKDMPGIMFWIFLPLHLLLNIVTVGFFLLRGQCRLILRAKWNGIKGLPHVWKKRKKLQGERIPGLWHIWKMMDKQLVPNKKKLGFRTLSTRS